MKKRHIILIAIAFAIIISCVGAVSAGLFDIFDFGSDSDSDTKHTVDVKVGNITNYTTSAVKIDTNKTGSSKEKYNVTCTAKIDISNLNQSARKILEEGLNKNNKSLVKLQLTFNDSENSTTLYLLPSDQYDIKIEGDILYINASDTSYSEIFSGDYTLKKVKVRVYDEDGGTTPIGTFTAKNK